MNSPALGSIMDSFAHGFICTWIHLHMDLSAPGFICTWIHLHMDSSAHGFISIDLWIDLGSKPGTIHWLNEMVGPFLLSAPKNFAMTENNRIPTAS
jgi:hypothetical protein